MTPIRVFWKDLTDCRVCGAFKCRGFGCPQCAGLETRFLPKEWGADVEDPRNVIAPAVVAPSTSAKAAESMPAPIPAPEEWGSLDSPALVVPLRAEGINKPPTPSHTSVGEES